MLAAMPWAQVDALLRRHPPERLTANTLADPARLQADLELTARRGYSIDDEERAPGVLCIGAPIRDHSGATVAAVSISGPAFRVREHGIEANAHLVIEAADNASLRLGGPAELRSAVERPTSEVRS
jgi:IclR family acetate operon transcriptional repressor